jgi:hypothetical protein
LEFPIHSNVSLPILHLCMPNHGLSQIFPVAADSHRHWNSDVINLLCSHMLFSMPKSGQVATLGFCSNEIVAHGRRVWRIRLDSPWCVIVSVVKDHGSEIVQISLRIFRYRLYFSNPQDDGVEASIFG